MPWIFPCPACDHPIRPRPGQQGNWVRCPMCQHRLQIPVTGTESDPTTGITQAPPPSARPSAVPNGPENDASVAAPGSSAAGFWRGLVAGVGFVVLAAVVVLGVRGLWPARTPPSYPEIPDPNLPGPLTARPPQGGDRGKGEIRKDHLDLQDSNEPRVGLGVPTPVAATNLLQPVTQLPPFLSMVSAPQSGHLLLGGERGELLLYRQKDLGLVAKFVLRGPAYALALDETRGRLYAAVGLQPRMKADHLKGRETPPADLHAYDVSALLQGKPVPEPSLSPVRQFALRAAVSSLVLGRDGKQLLCISENNREAQIRRINTDDFKEEQQPMPARPGATLSLAPKGDRLFVLGSGRLTSYDVATGNEQGQVVVGLNMFSPLPIDENRVLMLERQSTWQVVVVDVANRKALSRWEMVGLEGRPSMAFSPANGRFYIGSSAVLQGQVWELDCAAEKLTKPVLTRHLQTTHDRLLRGPLHLTDDGQYVLLGNGVVLRGA